MEQNQNPADLFDLPPMNFEFEGVSPEEVMEMLGQLTNHNEATTPSGTNCYASQPEDQMSMNAHQDQFQTMGQENTYSQTHSTPIQYSGTDPMDHDSNTPGAYYDAHQSINHSGSISTPSRERPGMTNANAGPAYLETGARGTPNDGNAMATPRSAQPAVITPARIFNRHNELNAGLINNGLPSNTSDPFVSPRQNVRSNPNGYQPPTVSDDVEIPDASDLIINQVQPPPSLMYAEQANGGQSGAYGNGHNRRQATSTSTLNDRRTVTAAQGIYQSAECLIRSLEAVCEQTRISLQILAEQTRNAPIVYNECVRIPNAEERKYHWERYISELRSQYDSLRDCLWGCVRYLVSRLSVWCREYRHVLPDIVFHRGVAALRVGKTLKVEIDRFRYPDLSMMALARISHNSNTGNGNANAGNQQPQ